MERYPVGDPSVTTPDRVAIAIGVSLGLSGSLFSRVVIDFDVVGTAERDLVENGDNDQSKCDLDGT